MNEREQHAWALLRDLGKRMDQANDRQEQETLAKARADWTVEYDRHEILQISSAIPVSIIVTVYERNSLGERRYVKTVEDVPREAKPCE